MRKHILHISVAAVALIANGATYAKGPGSAGGGQGYGTMSGQGVPPNTQPKEQERQRVKDGSGVQHENRTLTQEQKEVKTQNEAQIRQKTQTQVKPRAPSEEPKQLQEQIEEKSRQQLRVNP